MSTEPLKPGRETSELAAVKQAQIWITFAATIIVAIAGGLLQTGAIPPDSAWVAILTMIVTVLGGITGVTMSTGSYVASRTALKIAQTNNGTPNGGASQNPPATID
jgi:uncharacterized membrane protein